MSECLVVRDLLVLRPGDWSPDERRQVEAHLDACPDCAALADANARQDRLIRAVPRTRLTSSQRSQLLSRIQRERRRHEMRTNVTAIMGTAVAAVALIALALGLYVLLRGSDQPAVGVPLRTTGAPTTPVPLAFADQILISELSLGSAVSPPISVTLAGLDSADLSMLTEVDIPSDVHLALTWRVVAPPSADWRVFVHLMNDRDELVLQSDETVAWPERACAPGTADEDCTVVSEHTWRVSADFLPGRYTIVAGLYDPESGVRAPVTLRAGTTQTQVELGWVTMVEPWVFAGEIRSVEAGGPASFTLGERSAADASAPGKLYLPADVPFVLNWQVLAPPSADWNVFVHLVNQAGELVRQSDVAIDWPEQPCTAGEVVPECLVVSEHEWPFPADFPPGRYSIVVGLYDPGTGMRAAVTRPSGTTTQVTLGQVDIMARETVSKHAQVTLHIFSGRPDPAWTLAPAQDAELRQRLQALPVTRQPFDAPGGLGYSGFELLLPAADGQPAQRVSVWKGVMRVEADGEITVLADEDRGLERWLLDTAAEQVEDEVIEAVRRELDARAPTTDIEPESEGEFAIYLTARTISPAMLSQAALEALELEPDPILSTDEVLRYVGASHKILLTSSAFERINQLRVPIDGRAFVVCVGGERIYRGAFWTMASSLSFDGVVIAVPLVDASLRLQLGYPASPDLFAGEDPRSDGRILQALQRAGKLE
jgi:hypothetical protein